MFKKRERWKPEPEPERCVGGDEGDEDGEEINAFFATTIHAGESNKEKENSCSCDDGITFLQPPISPMGMTNTAPSFVISPLRAAQNAIMAVTIPKKLGTVSRYDRI